MDNKKSEALETAQPKGMDNQNIQLTDIDLIEALGQKEMQIITLKKYIKQLEGNVIKNK